jgi:uncharacterized protein
MDMSRTMNHDEKKALLELARASIARQLKQDRPMPELPDTPALKSGGGAFVTLHKGGKLRGCIGCFTGEGALTDTVEKMARSAAFEDPRFPPLKASELDEVDLEISVLTPMTRIKDPETVEVGRHGLYMIRGMNRGVLLPQVAVEQGWDKHTFLEHTCYKAGLDGQCWQDPSTEIYVFSADVFGEKDEAEEA